MKEMGAEIWSVTASPAGRKLCDSCKSSVAAVFCRADSAFLCPTCDGEVHAANLLASRHARVRLCDVCEQAPAAVTCRADAATLCSACDRDIHSANPLARRHQRHPIAPFYDGDADSSDEEAEAASWLLPDADPPGSPGYGSEDYLFGDQDLDLDLIPGGERKPQQQQQRKRCTASADGIVPVGEGNGYGPELYPGPVVNGYPSYDLEYPGPKPFLYNFTSQGISQSISSSSMDVSIVPDNNSMIDVSNTLAKSEATPTPVSGVDREARVLRYREKRKNRRFEKTIRYASRKAYAETRPRIKGRFVKRTELGLDSLHVADVSYGVVPTF